MRNTYQNVELSLRNPPLKGSLDNRRKEAICQDIFRPNCCHETGECLQYSYYHSVDKAFEEGLLPEDSSKLFLARKRYFGGQRGHAGNDITFF